MDTSKQTARRHVDVLDELHHEWTWMLALGVSLAVLGMIALGATVAATIASVAALGVLLVIGGAIQAMAAHRAIKTSRVVLNLVVGILYVLAGLAIASRPLVAAVGMTLLLAVFFLIAGVFRSTVAVAERSDGWGWSLASGLLTVVLGLLVLQGWPSSSLWFIGVLVGVDLLAHGVAWIAVALGARRLPATPSHA